MKPDGLYLNHVRHLQMIELLIPVFIAVGTGLGVIHNRIHNRINSLDRRVDGVELNMVKDFVSKTDLNILMDKMESHLIRMEDKLDAIVKNKCY